MTYRTLDYEERLRAALRAAAESVEPDGDGLERIRARIHAPRPATAAWLATEAEPSGLGPVVDRLRSFPAAALRWLRPVTAGGAPAPYGWLRPLAAAAAFVLVVGTGALALTQNLTQSITPVGQNGQIGSAQTANKGSGGNHPGGGTLTGPGSTQVPTPSSSGSVAAVPSSPGPSSQPSPSCSAKPTPNPTVSGGPPVSTSPSPTPSSPSPSPTPSSPAPSPSDSGASPTTGASATSAASAQGTPQAVAATPLPSPSGQATGTPSPNPKPSKSCS